jgi:ABC-type polysaccharide/polyol phosphate transport system ATPase subunit
MSDLVIKVESLSKAYQLGEFSTGTISNDLKRWWAIKRGKEDPFLSVVEENDRSKVGVSNMVWSLRDLDFQIAQGESVGIIGRNGAGKSTLLKILSQITSPTQGTVKLKGRIASLLEVGTGFHPELSGRENIYLNGAILGMSKVEIKAKFDEIVAFSGVERYIDTPVKRYSSGMYVRLAFAVAAHLESEILIVDEVLAVGDAEFQKKCLGKMNDLGRSSGRTIIFVSHNMTAIKALCNNGIYLKNGQLVSQGQIDSVISDYLSSNRAIADANGVISSEQRISGTGEARFLKILTYSQTPKEIKTEFYFGERFLIEFDMKVSKDIEDVFIGLHLFNVYGEKIAMDMPDKSYRPQGVKKGIQRFTIDFREVLMPGDYFFGLSMSHFYSGSDIDFVENIAYFKILRDSFNDELNYPWPTIHGYTQVDSVWNSYTII